MTTEATKRARRKPKPNLTAEFAEPSRGRRENLVVQKCCEIQNDQLPWMIVVAHSSRLRADTVFVQVIAAV
jgi:hypothetical protein